MLHDPEHDDEILTRNGWTMVTSHPLEITHFDGSHASGLPAYIFLEYLYNEDSEEV